MRNLKPRALFFIFSFSSFLAPNFGLAQVNRRLDGWEKYDFMPGYQLMFYDNFTGDRAGQKPEAWKIIEGKAEVSQFNNQFWLRALNETFAAPMVAALPGQFSLELDFYVTPRGYSGNYRVDVYGQTDNDWVALTIEDIGAYFNTSWGLALEYPFETPLKGRHHLAMLVNEDGFKCYVDSMRVASTPKNGNFRARDLEIFMPGGEKEGDDKSLITNIRLLAWDKSWREQLQQSGKIVSYGIPFAAGAATPKPEAAATLKELANFLQNDITLNLSIEAHVYEFENDGKNNDLSKQRAEAIVAALTKIYKVDEERLRTRGWGNAKPLKDNDTVDGRAANQRMEFVKR